MSVISDLKAATLELSRKLQGEAVTYHAGDVVIQITHAIPMGGARLEERDGGVILQSDHLEWGIARGDLVDADDVEITPARGHTIEWTWKGKTLTFAVLPDASHQCWRWSDRGQSQYRIYSKLKVSLEP